MLWVVVDVLIALLALVALGVGALRLYRTVKAFSRESAAASDKIAVASDALSAAQASRPQPDA